MKYFGYRIWLAVQKWVEIDGTFIAASVSFYASLAIFPLIIVLMSIFGWLLASSKYFQDWEQHLLDIVAQESSQRLANQLSEQLQQVESGAIISGPIGFLTLIVFSVALFVNLEHAFHRVWQVKWESDSFVSVFKRILLHRLRAFLMLLSIILIVVLNFALNLSIEVAARIVGNVFAAELFWSLAHFSSSILLNAIMFTTLFQTIPQERVLWRHAFLGGLLTSLTWEIGRWVLAAYVVSERYTAFGVVGVFLAVMLWLFYGMNVIIFGATYVRVLGETRNLHRPSANPQPTARTESLDDSPSTSTDDVENEVEPSKIDKAKIDETQD